jgi:hypothetical protein
MNPYEDSLPELSDPERTRSLNWFLIGQAAAIYFIASFMCALIFSKEIETITMAADLISLLTVLPWIAGAIYLAWRVKSLWAIHGLIYSLIPPMALFLNNVVTVGLYPELFLAVTIWQLSSTVVSMFTMIIIRNLLKAVRTQ